jgi:hypothetical protein
MYRCYNGNLYKRGGQVSGVSKERVHPNDVVRIELDHDAHTLSYRINGDKDQGVCFTDVVGEVFPAVAFYGANRAVRLMAVESAGPAGAGMRYYPAADVFKRKRWEGEMACGLRHGYGKLTYTHTSSYWVGTWKQDKQHGLHAWVTPDPTTGLPQLPVELVVFEHDIRRRPATERDLAAAAREWDGWACLSCLFVSRAAMDVCHLCGAVRAVQEKGEEGTQEERLDSRLSCTAAILTRLAALGTLYNSHVGEEGGFGGRMGTPRLGGGGCSGDTGGARDSHASATVGGANIIQIGVGGGLGGPILGPTGSLNIASSPSAAGGPAGHGRELTLAFCAEPSLEVFTLLHGLLKRHQPCLAPPSGTDDGPSSGSPPCPPLAPSDADCPARIVHACLRLLRTNFDRLVSSHVDPADVGIRICTTQPDPSSPPPDDDDPSLYPLRRRLEWLMTHCPSHPEVGQAAADALAAGMEVLYPDTQIRCSLLCHLLSAHTDASAFPTSQPASSLGQATLLDRLLRRFGTNEGVVALLPSPSAAPTTETSRLLEYLFKALHMEKVRRPIQLPYDVIPLWILQSSCSERASLVRNTPF